MYLTTELLGRMSNGQQHLFGRYLLVLPSEPEQKAAFEFITPKEVLAQCKEVLHTMGYEWCEEHGWEETAKACHPPEKSNYAPKTTTTQKLQQEAMKIKAQELADLEEDKQNLYTLYTDDSVSRCREKINSDHWHICTRPKGHKGVHVAVSPSGESHKHPPMKRREDGTESRSDVPTKKQAAEAAEKERQKEQKPLASVWEKLFVYWCPVCKATYVKRLKKIGKRPDDPFECVEYVEQNCGCEAVMGVV